MAIRNIRVHEYRLTRKMFSFMTPAAIHTAGIALAETAEGGLKVDLRHRYSAGLVRTQR